MLEINIFDIILNIITIRIIKLFIQPEKIIKITNIKNHLAKGQITVIVLIINKLIKI